MGVGSLRYYFHLLLFITTLLPHITNVANSSSNETYINKYNKLD